MATTAEELQVKISAKFDEFQAAGIALKAEMAEMKESVLSGGEGIVGAFERIESGMMGLTALFTGGFIAKEFTGEVADTEIAAGKLGRQLGVSATEAQAYTMAMKASGVPTEAFAGAANALTREIVTNQSNLEKWGVAFKDDKGNLLSLNEVVMNAVGVVKKYKEGIDQEAVAKAISKRGSADLLAMTRLNSEAVEDATRFMKEFGISMDPGVAREYKRSIEEVKDIFEAIRMKIGQQLLPVITEMAKGFTSHSHDIVAALKAIGDTATVIGAQIKSLSSAFSSLIPNIDGVEKSATALHAGMALLEGLIVSKVIVAIGKFGTGMLEAATASTGLAAILGGPITQIIALTAAVYGAATAWETYYKSQEGGKGHEGVNANTEIDATRAALDQKKAGELEMEKRIAPYPGKTSNPLEIQGAKDRKAELDKEIESLQKKLQTLQQINAEVIRTSTTETGKFALQMAAAESSYGLPSGVLPAIMHQESGGNPDVVSPKGAAGLMQMIPSTAAQYGVTNRFDPGQEISGAAHFLSDMLKQFGGDLQKALAAYNAGPDRVTQAVKSAGTNWMSKMPAETQKYVPAVMGRMGKKEAPEAPGLSAPASLFEDEGSTSKLADAKLKLAEQEINEEASARLRGLAKEKAEVEAAYKAEEISASEYYSREKVLDEQSVTVTVAALEKKKALYQQQLSEQTKGSAEYITTLTQIKTIEGQMAQTSNQGAIKQIEDATKIGQAHKALQKILDETKAKLDAITGKGSTDTSATKAKVTEQYQPLMDQFRQTGSTEGMDLTSKLINVETAKENIDKIKAAWDAAIAEMQAKEMEATNQHNAGMLSEYGMRQKIEEAEKSETPILQGLIDKYKEMQGVMGNPDSLTPALVKMQTQLQTIKTTTDSDFMNVTKNMQSSFADAFASIITRSQSAGQAMEAFFKSIQNNLAKLVANKISDSIFGGSGMGSLFGGAATGAAAAAGSSSGSSGASGGSLLGALLGSVLGINFGGSNASGGGAIADLGGMGESADALSSADSEMILGHAAQGAETTGQGGLFMLHPNEMVLPANIANTVRAASTAGTSSNIQASSSQSSGAVQVQLTQGAANMTLRDWMEREITGIYANR
jgi:hypothetical protein